MTKLYEWEKESGEIVTLNDEPATVAKAEALGWKRAEEPVYSDEEDPEVEPDEDLDYQKALILAMKKEKAAFMLYTDLADQADDAELKDVFKALAQEEAKHKLRFEIEYDNVYLRDN